MAFLFFITPYKVIALPTLQQQKLLLPTYFFFSSWVFFCIAPHIQSVPPKTFKAFWERMDFLLISKLVVW
jgi:hypothetical protein